MEARRVAEEARRDAERAITEAKEAQEVATHRAEELSLETEKLRLAQHEAAKWYKAHYGWAREAEAARKAEAEARQREATAGETAKRLAHDVLLYHSKVGREDWETQARTKALHALSISPGAAAGVGARPSSSGVLDFDSAATPLGALPSGSSRTTVPRSPRGMPN